MRRIAMANKEANNKNNNVNVYGAKNNQNQKAKNNNEEFASEFQVDNNRRPEAAFDRNSFEQERSVSERTAWN